MSRRFKRRFSEFSTELASSPQSDIDRTTKMALRAAVSQHFWFRKLQLVMLRDQPRCTLALCNFFFRENDQERTKLAFRGQNVNKSRCQFPCFTGMLSIVVNYEHVLVSIWVILTLYDCFLPRRSDKLRRGVIFGHFHYQTQLTHCCARTIYSMAKLVNIVEQKNTNVAYWLITIESNEQRCD
jgi:hypothetical protein